MVSALVNLFGMENIDLAEDVVQDTLLKALETWKFHGIPKNPSAWFYRVAKNKAIDILRRNKFTDKFISSIENNSLLGSEYTIPITVEKYWTEDHLQDNFLGMIYACSHPELNTDGQISFMLKLLCGFSTKEIAKAFLTSEDTISKRIHRVKKFYQTNQIIPKIPSKEALAQRTQTVLNVIYLIFNEGYHSTHSTKIIRKDLITQALYLCNALVQSSATSSSSGYALLSLMCFHTARLESRCTSEGDIILLKDQDRNLWDKDMINIGIRHLSTAISDKQFSNYHLEAMIALEHCNAKNFKSTDWKKILYYYEILLKNAFDPVTFLNKCLVVMEMDGAKSALEEIKILEKNPQIQSYYLYHSTLGELYYRSKNIDKATIHWQKAIDLTQSKKDKEFLIAKLAALP